MVRSENTNTVRCDRLRNRKALRVVPVNEACPVPLIPSTVPAKLFSPMVMMSAYVFAKGVIMAVVTP